MRSIATLPIHLSGDMSSNRAGAREARDVFRPRFAWCRPSILFSSLAVNILSLGLPIVILQVYDRVIPNGATETLVFLLMGLVGALFFESILRVIRHHLTGWWAARFEHRANCSAMRRLLSTDITSFEREAPGAQLDRVGSVEALRDFYGGQAFTALIDLPFVVVFLVLIALIAGPLVAVPLAALVIAGALAVIAGRRLRGAIEARQTNDDRRYNFVIEVLGGVQTVKGLGLESVVARRHERLQEASAAANDIVSRRSAHAQNMGELFSQLTMGAVAGFGSLMVLEGQITIGMLAGCTLLAGRTMQPLLRALGAWTQFQRIRIAEQQAAGLMSLPLESSGTARPLEGFSGAIELQDVVFSYPAASEPALNGVNLRVEPGETIAIRGDSGVGKSTLLWCILGFLKPQAGRVLLDGVDRDEFDLASVREHFSYLPQNGELFRGTILDNLTMFRGEADTDKAMEFARKLGLDSVLAYLPEGLKTKIGESASETLPRGVRQQIAMIRALVTGGEVILFDESNTAFDSGGDARLKDLIAELKGRHTIILITHRPSLARLASRVFELRDGKLWPADPDLDTARISRELDQHGPPLTGAAEASTPTSEPPHREHAATPQGEEPTPSPASTAATTGRGARSQ